MRRWLLPAALACACVVPVLAGAYRGAWIVSEGVWAMELSPEQVDRLPLFLHVVGSAVFYALAVLQVLPAFRAQHPLWHRRAGKLAWVAGLLGALAGTWMSAAHLDISGPVLLYGRLLFGPVWVLFLVLGFIAIRRRDFARHGAFMVRAFAVAMPAGTLPFIFAPFALLMGEVPQVLDESIQACAWIVHLAAAELLIRRRRLIEGSWPYSPTLLEHAPMSAVGSRAATRLSRRVA